MSLFIQQIKTVIKKNFLFYTVKKVEILKELLVPIVSALVFYVGRPQQQQEENSDFKLMNNMFSLMLPIYLPTTITGFAKKHLISFVHEKHERYKETQKIMGLTQRAYITGWLMTSYLMILPIGLITIFSLYYSGYGQNGSFLTIGINYAVYLIASVHQTYAISTFFSSPKLAGEIGIFILSMSSLIYFYITYGTQVSDTSFALICLFPQTAISFSVLQNSTPSSTPSSANNDNPAAEIANQVMGNTYNSNTATFMLFFDVFFYLILYFYLDEVIPNEYGLRRSPFFIFKRKFWSQIFGKAQHLTQNSNYIQFDNQVNDQQQQTSLQNKEFTIEMGNEIKNIQNESLLGNKKKKSDQQSIDYNFRQVSMQTSDRISLGVNDIEKNSNQGQPLIKIIDLKKNFGKVHAVNGISLNLYQNQILCLLGHNGAGKTTTISLLTGLIEKTEGQILYFDQELEGNIDEIRQQLGLCTQKDVLYDYLTVTQHLEFIASIKGHTKEQIDREVQQIINEVCLQNEKDKLAETLSGGNKRKLSLGMALVGGSKIIYLDEPTSGMDAVSRQQIWDILDKIRESRAIILTTHHLEEAEKLSDRIAIMSKGKILIDGKSDQIKKEYGVGYHLTLSSKSAQYNAQFEQSKQQLSSLILQQIPGSKLNQQSAKDSLKFILPFDQIDQYASCFEEVEKIDFININLSINSLEDAFINIGVRDELQSVGLDAFSDDFNHIDKPSALFASPQYSFFSQFLAMFKRQYYMTIRNWAAVLMILLPIGFILLGVYVAKHFLDKLEEYFKIVDDVTGDDKGSKELKNSFIFPLKMYFLNIFIVQAYTMNSSIYINTPVLEREFQLKYALNVMGCRPLPYWLGTLAFDYLIYFITFLIFFYGIYAAQVEFIMPYLTPLFIIMTCFGVSLITFCYACGTFFKNSNSAFKYFPIIAYFISYTIPWIVLQLTKFSFPQLYSIFQYLFLFLSPFLTLEKALQNIDITKRKGVLNNLADLRSQQIFESWQAYCIVIAISSVVYLICIMLYERKYYSLSGNDNKPIPIVQQDQIDKGVQAEINRVNSLNNTDPIRCQQIHKVFPNGFHAVKGTTFGVEKGQIFGLLGPNGAGKSTTFNIVTANLAKSSGKVELSQKDITDNSKIYFDDIGVCPQTNCLWEYLKPKEHLKLFGRVKGLTGKDLNEVTNYYLKAMQLDSYKVKSSNLSGGNKRKLCVTNSLIASPALQFFDEPSTGLDPIAKRYLWKCLKDMLNQKDSSIVLTTHSLQEAEDLCHKVGIQVNGQFVCLDNLQQLKNEKGFGYKIDVKLINQPLKNQEEINGIIKGVCPNAIVLNENDKSYEENIIYQVPYEGFLFSQAFNLLQNNLKQGNKIQDFTITQASLEDIFIQLSKLQVEPTNQQQTNQSRSIFSLFRRS